MPITCRALSGAGTSDAPPCYLLQVDEAKILLDCGTLTRGEQSLSEQEEAQRHSYLETLKELAPSLTLVLLSNPQPGSMGLLPFLVHHAGLSSSCQIYASPPTITLGRIALRDWMVSLCNEFDPGFESQPVARPQAPGSEPSTSSSSSSSSAQLQKESAWKFTPLQLNDAMQRVSQIRYSSPVLLTGRNAPLTLVANRAGHTLGATIWTLRTPASEEVTYAPVWNHVRERTLDGGAILNMTQQVSAARSNRQRGIVIMGAQRSKTVSPKSRDRNNVLQDLITNTVKAGRSVLMPVDASARVVELLALLDAHWSNAKLDRYPLCFVSRTAEELKLAFTNLWEYFGQHAIASGLASSAKGLDLKHVHFYSSPQELEAAYPPHAAKCILTVPSTLSYGFSRAMAPSFLPTSGNVLILTTKPEPGTLAHWLFQRWQDAQESAAWGNDQGKLGSVTELQSEDLQLTLHHKVLLQGEELLDFEAKAQAEADRKAKEKALQDRSRRLKEAADVQDSDEDSSGDEEDEADGHETAASKQAVNDAETGFSGGFLDDFLPETSQGPIDLFVRSAPRSEFTTGVLQPDGSYHFPSLREQTRARLFPFVERRRKVDAFGEVIDLQAWQSTNKAGENKADAAATTLGKRKRDEPKEKAEPPHKYTSETLNLKVRCSVLVIDMEGKADGRALKTLLPHMNPKKLALIGADAESLEDLKAACTANASMTRDIYTPMVAEEVAIGDDVKSFSIRLDDSLIETVKMQRVDDYDIARLNGTIDVADASSIPSLTPEITQTSSSAVRRTARFLASFLDKTESAKALSSSLSTEEEQKPQPLKPLAPSLFIGDVRLAVLRQRLQSLKIPAAFAGEGVLVCGPVSFKSGKGSSGSRVDLSGGQVAVRKGKSGELLIEGQPGETFQLVRQTLYLLHAAAQ